MAARQLRHCSGPRQKCTVYDSSRVSRIQYLNQLGGRRRLRPTPPLGGFLLPHRRRTNTGELASVQYALAKLEAAGIHASPQDAE